MVEPPIISPPGKTARNEQHKAIATTCNAIAVAFLVSAFLQPLVSGSFSLSLLTSALMAFVAFQGALQYVLAQVED